MSVLIIFMLVSGINSEIEKEIKQETNEKQKDSIKSILKKTGKNKILSYDVEIYSKKKEFHKDSIYHFNQIKKRT